MQRCIKKNQKTIRRNIWNILLFVVVFQFSFIGISLADRKFIFANIGLIKFHKFLFVTVQKFGFLQKAKFGQIFLSWGNLGSVILGLVFWSGTISSKSTQKSTVCHQYLDQDAFIVKNFWTLQRLAICIDTNRRFCLIIKIGHFVLFPKMAVLSHSKIGGFVSHPPNWHGICHAHLMQTQLHRYANGKLLMS